MKCGGATKMKKGGAFIAGVPNAGMTGPNKNSVTETMKNGGAKKSFPDLNKDGKVTKADVLKGRGVIKKTGGPVKKMAKSVIVKKKK